MQRWIKYFGGYAFFVVVAFPAAAQIPAAPGAPAAAAAAPAAAPAGNLWSFLMPTQQQCDECQAKLCASPIGQMLNNSLRPVTALSGGMIPPLCPIAPNAAELAKAKAAGGAEGLAAEIKANEAGAKARRATVRYLGTVDCKRWPEAQDALVAALRTDPNECVRWEAAMALGSGCCCTKKTIAGLTHCVSGEGKDGNPPERSMRVKVAAMEALEHCLSCFEEKVEQKKEPEPSRPPERVTPPAPMPMPENTVRLTNYYDRIEAKSESVIIAEGRLVLLKAQQQAEVMDSPEMRKIMISADQNTDPQQPATTQRASTLPAPASPAPPQPQPPPPSAPPARRERGLFGVISRAWRSSDNQATPAAYQPTPPASKDAAPITRPLPLSK